MLINDINIEELLSEFVAEQHELFENDASEQSISHQMAMKLAARFPDWHVDCEYNRDGNDVKKLMYALRDNGPVNSRNVVPDIIVHKRMTTNNLLAIEVKKSTNVENSFKDLAKLNAFKGQLHYQHTLFVRFLAGSDGTGIAEAVWR